MFNVLSRTFPCLKGKICMNGGSDGGSCNQSGSNIKKDGGLCG